MKNVGCDGKKQHEVVRCDGKGHYNEKAVDKLLAFHLVLKTIFGERFSIRLRRHQHRERLAFSDQLSAKASNRAGTAAGITVELPVQLIGFPVYGNF
jgi:hypothetical protein